MNTITLTRLHQCSRFLSLVLWQELSTPAISGLSEPHLGSLCLLTHDNVEESSSRPICGQHFSLRGTWNLDTSNLHRCVINTTFSVYMEILTYGTFFALLFKGACKWADLVNTQVHLRQRSTRSVHYYISFHTKKYLNKCSLSSSSLTIRDLLFFAFSSSSRSLDVLFWTVATVCRERRLETHHSLVASKRCKYQKRWPLFCLFGCRCL